MARCAVASRGRERAGDPSVGDEPGGSFLLLRTHPQAVKFGQRLGKEFLLGAAGDLKFLLDAFPLPASAR